MLNSTVRRRGRHAAPPVPRPAPKPREFAPVRTFRPDPTTPRLPGMELLGFYDEPYQVRAEFSRPSISSQPRIAPIVKALVPQLHTSRVTNLWETTELDEGTLDWWKPHVIARRKLGGSRVRMLSVIASLLAAIMVLGLTWYLVQRPSQIAEESLGSLRIEASTLVETMPALRTLALTVGEENAPDLAAASDITLTAESAARSVFTSAGDIGASEAVRDAAVGGASGVLDATSRINRLVAFRLTAEDALIAPDLPPAPGIEDLSQVTEDIAAWRSQVEASLDGLPPTALESTREQIDSWVAAFDTWQVGYLDAVREGDTNLARSLRSSQEEQIASLRRRLREDLSTAGQEIAREIDDASELLAALLGE